VHNSFTNSALTGVRYFPTHLRSISSYHTRPSKKEIIPFAFDSQFRFCLLFVSNLLGIKRDIFSGIRRKRKNGLSNYIHTIFTGVLKLPSSSAINYICTPWLSFHRIPPLFILCVRYCAWLFKLIIIDRSSIIFPGIFLLWFESMDPIPGKPAPPGKSESSLLSFEPQAAAGQCLKSTYYHTHKIPKIGGFLLAGKIVVPSTSCSAFLSLVFFFGLVGYNSWWKRDAHGAIWPSFSEPSDIKCLFSLHQPSSKKVSWKAHSCVVELIHSDISKTKKRLVVDRLVLGS
jgi:hypothetical protein